MDIPVKADEIDYMAGCSTRSFGNSGTGNPGIYDLTNQEHCEAGRAQDPEHGAVYTRGSPRFERWRARLGHHSYWGGRLHKALNIGVALWTGLKEAIE